MRGRRAKKPRERLRERDLRTVRERNPRVDKLGAFRSFLSRSSRVCRRAGKRHLGLEFGHDGRRCHVPHSSPLFPISYPFRLWLSSSSLSLFDIVFQLERPQPTTIAPPSPLLAHRPPAVSTLTIKCDASLTELLSQPSSLGGAAHR